MDRQKENTETGRRACLKMNPVCVDCADWVGCDLGGMGLWQIDCTGRTERRRRHGRETHKQAGEEQEEEEGGRLPRAACDRYETLRGPTMAATAAYGFSCSALREKGRRRGSFSRVQRALFFIGGKATKSSLVRVPFLFSYHADGEHSSEERNVATGVATWCTGMPFLFLHERTLPFPPSSSSLKALVGRQLVLAHV